MGNYEGKVAVIYARYSSSRQRDVSIEQQVSECTRYAEKEGIRILKIYDDHAMTGTNDNRPAFQQMIKDSSAHAFELVLVYSLDRFSRDRYDTAVNKHALKENGVRVISATEPVGGDDPASILMESILEGFSEYYSHELARKIRRGIRSNAEKLMVIGHAPFGFTKGPDGRYQVVEEEAAIVQEIFRRVASGTVLAEIFRDLNERGIKTKIGKEWNRSSLSKMLSSEKYIGTYEFADVRVEGGIPAIIDRQLFEEVQQVIQSKKNPRSSPQRRRNENGTYLLTGKLFCGKCLAPMVGISGTARDGTLRYYYVCKGHRQNKNSCEMLSIGRDRIEEAVVERIQILLSKPQLIEFFCKNVKEYLEHSAQNEEIQLLQRQLDQIVKEKENTLKAIRTGLDSPSVREMLQEIEVEESSVIAKLKLAVDKGKVQYNREDIIALCRMLTDGDIKEKRYLERMIDSFLIKSFLYKDRIKLVLKLDPGTEYELPFDIKGIEKCPEAIAFEQDVTGSYKVTKWTQGELIRINMKIYFIKGYLVAVSRFNRAA